jgi:hypothetical protein
MLPTAAGCKHGCSFNYSASASHGHGHRIARLAGLVRHMPTTASGHAQKHALCNHISDISWYEGGEERDRVCFHLCGHADLDGAGLLQETLLSWVASLDGFCTVVRFQRERRVGRHPGHMPRFILQPRLSRLQATLTSAAHLTDPQKVKWNSQRSATASPIPDTIVG